MTEIAGYVYSVELTEDDPGQACVSLVRELQRESSHHLRHHTEVLERTVLFSRRFRALLDRVAIDSYAAQLSLVARYAQEGTFGCFAETRSQSGTVEIILYERWFDGNELHTDELTRHAFDASDEQALVASAEFLADVRLWAERRNQQREKRYLEELEADEAGRQLAADREAAGRELSQILADHTRAA